MPRAKKTQTLPITEQIKEAEKELETFLQQKTTIEASIKEKKQQIADLKLLKEYEETKTLSRKTEKIGLAVADLISIFDDEEVLRFISNKAKNKTSNVGTTHMPVHSTATVEQSDV